MAHPVTTAVAQDRASPHGDLLERIQRARPLLGTIVSIRIDAAPSVEAHRWIEAAFEAVEAIHRLMSFHEPSSDVSRLNREAAERAVRVHPSTFSVLARAVSFAAASDGAFDVTVAAKLVEHGLLPRPEGACVPDPAASWRDIELSPDGRVRFHRPLWIDLGGIAKGFAVDQAFARLPDEPKLQRCINAGGDLRVAGPVQQLVYLQSLSSDAEQPAMMLQNASLASSTGINRERTGSSEMLGPHLHGVYRRFVGNHSFVSVIAPECVVADALTKVVLALGLRADAVLHRFGAAAYLYIEDRGWSRLGVPV